MIKPSQLLLRFALLVASAQATTCVSNRVTIDVCEDSNMNGVSVSSTGCFSDVSALASVSTSITSFDFLQTSGANSQIAIYAAAWEALEALDLPNWQASTDCILGSAQQTTGFMQQTSIPPIGFNQTSLVVPKNLQVGLNFAGTATIGDSSLSSLNLQSNSQCTATFESGGETQTILFRVNNQCPTPQDLNPITVDDYTLAYADIRFESPNLQLSLDHAVLSDVPNGPARFKIRYRDPGCQKRTIPSGRANKIPVFESSTRLSITNELSDLANYRTDTTDDSGNPKQRFEFCLDVRMFDATNKLVNRERIDVSFSVELDQTIQDLTVLELGPDAPVNVELTTSLTASLVQCTATEYDAIPAGASIAVQDTAGNRIPAYFCLETDQPEQATIVKIQTLTALFFQSNGDPVLTADGISPLTQSIVAGGGFQIFSTNDQSCQQDPTKTRCRFETLLDLRGFPLPGQHEVYVDFEGTAELALASGRRRTVRTRLLADDTVATSMRAFFPLATQIVKPSSADEGDCSGFFRCLVEAFLTILRDFIAAIFR